ncbi:MAG: hybrid sensor histidine kinase/response regulator [Stigonema ocellatum SAG 48.90 = DSM 106950]|nr:hybrid sensor histidine kinase/response regulator [Stigonema ocellatum SAG 48.90 = DSM 106950]
MITDSSIREQGYIYFLYEAPELLQTIEQELFSLTEDYSIAKVHNLMRATHTIKGGAANIGLDVINKVAHSLEDVFKALYNPDVKIDAELRTLLFQGFECLQLPLMAEISNTSIDSEEILQRAVSVFAQLQEKLGDAYRDEAYIPTSEELGFDIVLSIFDTGVAQRLESISEVIKNPPENTELMDFLRSHAEVFLGLAQSLNLPGFGAIAQTTLTALETHPTLALKIAEIALADWQQGQEAVLAGDRTSGGKPSLALQKLTVATDETDNSSVTKSGTVSLRNEAKELYNFLTQSNKTKAKFYLKVIRYILGWFNHELEIAYQELSLTLLIPKKDAENTINHIEDWLFNFLDFLQDEKDSHSLYLYRQGVILTILLAVAEFQNQRNECDIVTIQTLQNKISKLVKEYQNYAPVSPEEKKWLDSPKLEKLLEIKEISTSSQVSDRLLESIWGEEVITSIDNPEVKNDEFLESPGSLAVSELLVTDTTEKSFSDLTLKNHEQIEDKLKHSHSNNSRQTSFIRVDVEALNRLNYLAGELLTSQNRRTLQDEQIKEIIERLLQLLQRHQTTLNQLPNLPLQMQSFDTQHKQNFVSVDFDSLEMDEYTEVHVKLHEATEETLQLQEAIESLDLIFKQATQVQEKQQHVALSIIDNLVEARMSPLGNILNRFPQTVQNLGDLYGKSVELKLTGTQVLVDKAITEKLYDPLLQLVRNAFDHGIEPPEIRSQHGKPAQGLIEISAYHQGSQTIIEVQDDGQGLNFEKIRSKAIELNLFNPDDVGRGYISNQTEEQLLQLLFSPGFSTAGKVSEISGRGMGLDIVRSQLQALNGSIAVQSFPNRGTTFMLKIPFSMTIDKLMLVQAGGIVYALLLERIEKILLPSAVDIKEFEDKKVFHWNVGKDERMVSIRKLSELLSYNCSFNSSANLQNKLVNDDRLTMSNPMVLLRQNQELLALEVDQIIGEQELVIRPLGQAIAPPKYVYGCSSLANGTLILVIDSALLVESCEMQATIDIMALPTNRSSQNKALPMSVSTMQSPLLLAPATGESNHKTPKVVLVVDDAISLRQMLSLTFQKSGYQVLQAQNGIEALEQLQQHPEVQVVISDLEMPRMNGFELLSNVRQNPDLANKPVVILTSRSTEKHRQLAQALGATAYFTKPYLEHEFLSTVENLIK